MASKTRREQFEAQLRSLQNDIGVLSHKLNAPGDSHLGAPANFNEVIIL